MAFFDTSLAQAAPSRRGALFTFAMSAFALQRQRAALKRLTDDDLRDVGLSRADVAKELAKPFWDVPATWRV